MPILEQCRQCKFYNQNTSLCYNNWGVIDFDDQHCDSFIDLHDCVQQDLHEIQDQDNEASFKSVAYPSERKSNIDATIQNLKRKRHWMVSLWLYFGTFVDIIILFFLLLSIIFDGFSVFKVGLVLDLSVNLIARTFLFKWNNTGFYILTCYFITCVFVSLIELICFGQRSGSFSSAAVGMGVMYYAFSRRTSDGLTFFDNIGIKIGRK